MEQLIPCYFPSFSVSTTQARHLESSSLTLSDRDAGQLVSAASTHTLDALFRTAWALVLRCYTGSDEVCFGYQSSGRQENRHSLSSSPPVPISAVCISLSDRDRLDDIAHRSRLHDVSIDAMQGVYPFNTVILLRENVSANFGSPSLIEQSENDVHSLPEKCRIRIRADILPNDVKVFLEWWSNEMSSEQIKRVNRLFGQALSHLLAGRDRTVGQLRLFTEEDWKTISKWNEALPQTQNRCIHDIIQEQVRREPAKEAINAWDGRLTYSELDSLSSRLAHSLQSRGVEPEVCVPLFFEKTKWYIVAMLGVLKAGGAFVPMDPSHPPNRLQSLIRTVGARIILCSSSHTKMLQNVTSVPVVTVDDSLMRHCRTEELVSSEVHPGNAAYVIFTSGSTGKPKGTLIEHRAFCSSAHAHSAPLRINSDSRVLQFAAHTFDASLAEILSPLMNGATICVPSEESRLNDLAGAINNLNANYMSLTPSVVGFLEPSMVPNVKTVILAGEAMSELQRDTWCKIDLVNGFGPTETSITSAVNSKVTEHTDCKDVGQPVGGRCWIVDPQDHDRLVPVGAPGEMLVEGPSLARGYLNDPRKTADVFVYDPAWAVERSYVRRRRRFYKTGDMVRYNSDNGGLTYLGRKDTQVKLHGQRVELGEIESCLMADTHILHAMVLVPKTGFAREKLVVVFCLSDPQKARSDQKAEEIVLDKSPAKRNRIAILRKRLGAKLPLYMVPTIWLNVESMPLLPSGKLDRKKVGNWLSEMEDDPELEADEDQTQLNSASDTERELARIWGRVLNIPENRIKLTESFLRLGGDSLAAMTCASQCKKAGIGLTVQDILRCRSIQDLAHNVPAVQTPSITYEEKLDEPFDLSPIQYLHSIVRKEDQGYFNQSVLTRLNRRIDGHSLKTAVEALVARHSMLRARFSTGPGGKMQQQITRKVHSSYRLRYHKTENLNGIEQIMACSQRSIDCFVGPVIAVDLIEVEEEGQLMFLVAHHLVVDIVSWRLILEDLEEMLLEPEKAALARSSLPFQTWCSLQAERSALRPCEELESLPPNDLSIWGIDNSAVTYGDVECSTFEVDAENTSLILTECHGSANTEAVDILLASLLQSFGKAFPRGPVPVIYNEGHGREAWDYSIDISRTVGWFTTLYPIWIQDVSRKHPVETVLRVKDIRRRAVDNGRALFAYSTLTEEGRKKYPHPTPMGISFNYLGQNRDLQNKAGLFRLADQMVGETREGGGSADFGRDTPRFALVEISAAVANGRLRFTFSFNKAMRHQDRLQSWISHCQDVLESLPRQMLSLAPTRTLSDFPMLPMNHDDFQKIQSSILPNYGVTSIEEVEDMYPCTRMQQGILLSRCRNSSLYAVHTTFEVRDQRGWGSCRDRLVKAWNKMLTRHSMLRTIFVNKLTSRVPFGQVVLKGSIHFQPNYLECANEDQVVPTFDNQQPVATHSACRFSMCKIQKGKIFCRLEMNHAAMDGESISILLRDLRQAYAESGDGLPIPQFRDFYSHLESLPPAAGVDYWSSYLEGVKPCHLPVNSATIGVTSALRTMRLDFPGCDRLNQLCKAVGVTPSTVFNVAWGLVLSTFVDSDDVCFAYTTSLRDAPVKNIESVVGPVMNLTVCRIQLPATSRLLDVFQCVQNDYTESIPHRSCSLIDIQHRLKLSRTSLFNTGLSYRKLADDSSHGARPVEFVQKGLIHDPAETCVYVNVEATDREAQIELNYWTDCLSDKQAEVVAKVFCDHLDAIINDCSKEVGQLNISTEQKTLVQGSNYASESCSLDFETEPCYLPALGSSTEIGIKSERINIERSEELRDFCLKNDVPASSIFELVWGLILRLYSGAVEVCFGVLSITDYAETDDFGNLSVSGIILNNEVSVLEALQKLMANSVQTSQRQIPSSQFLQGLKDEYPFNSIIYTQPAIGKDITHAVIKKLLSSAAASALVNVSLSSATTTVDIHFSSDRISELFIDNIVSCFKHLLYQIIEVDLFYLKIDDLNFFDDLACSRVRDWNRAVPDKYEKCVHEVIEMQTWLGRTFAPAICAWDEEMTYSELWAASTRLSHHLRRMGVQPETIVALCFDKSAWAIVSQLAVLQAGGAFVSLDPSHAEGRLQTLIEQVQSPLVLCSPAHYAKSSRICKTAYAVDRYAIDGLSDTAPPAGSLNATPRNAAYVVFTSGTTGTPKAIVIEHASLTTAAMKWNKALFYNSETRAFQFSNFTFDASIMDIYFTLLNGGCLCIPSEEERMNDPAGAVRRTNANLMTAVPSFINSLNPDSIPSVKTLIMGGEKMPLGAIEKWKDRRVINAYGPSEATITAASSIKTPGDGTIVNRDCSDIGINHCGRTWIVDPSNYNRLVPSGAVGELVLEGPNVGRGYFNNDERTKQSFIIDPAWARDPRLQDMFSKKERMYRTGDLVRYTADGTLSFLSRADTQIKLNGQRIELGEIEYHCAALLPSTSQVVVEMITPRQRTIAPGLAAFFTSSLEEGESGESSELLLPLTASRTKLVEQLRTGLLDRLPFLWIPKFYFPIRYMPRSASSKLDRRRLRETAEPLSKAEVESQPVSTSSRQRSTGNGLEAKLRTLWEQVINLVTGSVTDDDNFFGLGGDSLAAMNLVSAAQSQGISLNVSDVFQHPVLLDLAGVCEVSTITEVAAIKPFELLPAYVPVEEVMEEAADYCDVPVSSIVDIYPCSPVQEGLITSSTTQEGAYVARCVYRLADSVDLKNFKAAWQKTVDELEILRTRIVHTAEANFCQVVLKSAPIQWVQRDTPPTASENLPALPSEQGGPLTQYEIAETKSSCYFIWSLHHAIYDGWSMPLILQQTEANYLLSTGRPIVSYNLFIRYLQQRDLAESDEFWKTYLSGFSSPSFPPMKGTKGGKVSAGKQQYVSMELRQSVPNVDMTLPVMVRAAWALVIAGQTDSGDVCFGETLMGRNINLPGVTEMVGPVLTTVPTRVKVNRQSSILSYLSEINQQTIDAIPHQHSGIQRIRKLGQDASAACDFQNLLVVQTEGQEVNDKLWKFEELHASEEFFTYPLVVECKIAGSQVRVTAHHDEAIVAGWKVQRLIHQFNFLLEQLIEMPKQDDRTLADLDFVCSADKEQIADWNKGRNPSVERCIHDVIQEQLTLHPESQAICAWDGALTYRQMWNLSSTLASYLISLGVGPEKFVPICMDKSVWAVVGVLGILMAGGAFVPLDPAHPKSRHDEIIDDVDAEFLICTPKYSHKYTAQVKNVIPLDGQIIETLPASLSQVRPNKRPTSSNMAFALFTSGSTGRPKGIVTEHASLLSSVMAFGPVVNLARGTRAFHFASLTFDAAVMEVLGTLVFGGCVCVPSEEERLNHISGAIRRMNVSWAFCTPSVASILEPSSVPSLKTLVCGGEMLSVEVIKKWSQCATLINGYGPTETTIFATLNTGISPSTEPACIGRGIKSTCTWIVDPDDHNRLVPVGEIGELALSGRPLAREYLKRPKKTATEFIENPRWASHFPGTSAQRIYKTGDLVRYYPDGSVEYLGRKDHQVKLHGQRMELGEIESRLGQMNKIRHSVVLLPKTGLLKKRLIGVLSLNGVTGGDTSLISKGDCELVDETIMESAGISEIRKSLESQLPKYMVPQAWVVLRSLPMLVSGKIDRKQITAWIEKVDRPTYERIMQDEDKIGKKAVNSGSQSMSPERSAIDILRDVCATVLNLSASNLDVNRSFISLGGDSISGMALVSRARKQGLTIKLRDILQVSSIKELAQSATFRETVRNKSDETGKLFSLSPIQDLYFRSAVEHKGASRFNQSITVRVARRIDQNTLQEALRAIVSRHGMLRSRFVLLPNGSCKQKIVKDVESSYRLRNHVMEANAGLQPRIAETQCSLDIEAGPILGADLFTIAGDEQVLFLVAHHLCIDMVSWRVVLQDLEDFLQTGVLSTEIPLSFQSWCDMQQAKRSAEQGNYEAGFVNEASNSGYWGMKNTRNTYGQVKTKTIKMEKELTESALGSWHESLQTEPLDFLLAVAFHSFSQTFTDRELPVIYNESHGRQSSDSALDVSGTVGWFTALQRLRVSTLSGNILDTMRQIKENREGSHNLSDFSNCPRPLEIMFNYLGKLQQLERQDSLFQHYGQVFTEEDMTSFGDMGPDTARFALFELTAIVLQDSLQVSFTFNKNMRRQGQLQEWISMFDKTLRSSVSQLRSLASNPIVRSFPLLPATQGELQQLINETLPRLGVYDKENIEDIYPCSPVQEGILLSQLRDPSSYIFHTVFEVTDNRSRRPIDANQLLSAWQQVINRHPIMRTIFVESNYKNGTFDQIVLKKVPANCLEVDCDGSTPLARLNSVKMQDRDANGSPQLPHQITICQESTGRMWLKIEMNHALIDGGSVSVLLRDFSAAYGSQLPTSPGPLYSDYVKYLRTSSYEEDVAHWTQYLHGIEPCHFPSSGSIGFKRQLNSLMVGFNRYDALQRLCQKESITFANLTLATWAVVLRAFTGQDDVCFGYPSAGRDAPVSGIQDGVGVFINMLCCRVQFSQQQSFTGIFKSVQKDYLDGLPHQKCSLAQIQNQLGMGGKMLFNTTLSIQNEMPSDFSIPSDFTGTAALSFKAQEIHDPSEYAITVNVLTGKGNEGIMLRYWSDIISDSQAQRIASTIVECFENSIQDPSQSISTLSELSRRGSQTPDVATLQSSISKLIDVKSLQKLVDDRIHEVISQILGKEGLRKSSTGNLPTPDASRQSLATSVMSYDGQSSTGSVEAKINEVESLPDDSSADISPSEKQVPSKIEQKLLGLWSTSLEVAQDSIKPEDSFFKLGGDSIQAMKMASAAREQGLALRVSDIFRYPHFEEMADIVATKTMESESQVPGSEDGRPVSQMGQTAPMYSAVNLDPKTLQENIYPKIGLFKGEVIDILPVTDFQAMCLTGQQFSSRWMLNYFYFDGAGPLDIRRLEESCTRVIETFDILRSVFVCSGKHFYQVVLKRVKVNLSVYETDKPLDEFTENLQKWDREQPLRQGEVFVKFFVAKKANSNSHRILIRLSHAQYDGVCLSKLLDAMKQGYEAGPLPLTSSFASHMRLLSSSVTPWHYRHYSALLNGSKMPQIIRRKSPNNFTYVGACTGVSREVEISMAANANITVATVVQAAWALTLAKISGQSDVVFGLTINGRNASFPGIETAVGPCVNVIPVRVKFGRQWNGLDLFRYIQDQQVANMPYENLGFREIIHHCTDWPRWSYFSTAVFHQNVPYEGFIELDENRYRIGGAGVVDNLSDLTLVSTPVGDTHFRIGLHYSEKGPINSAFASRILEKACDAIEGLTTRPSALLPSSTTLESLPVHAIDDLPRPSDEDRIASYLKMYEMKDLLVYSAPLNRAWQQVLLPDQNPNRINGDLHPHTSFFSLGGDVFNMAQIACLLQEHGFGVRIEDLLEHPTLIGHMFVLRKLSQP